ncbi:MAG: VOC family protein [Firmicutes bacterium]|nr:VOC family protein [Bacillota bacterium]
MKYNDLIPELTVSNIEQSKHFYAELLGFTVEYAREEDKFIFISLDGCQLMLEELHAQSWLTDELQPPFGRGINLSLSVADLQALYERVLQLQLPLFRPLMLSEYRVGGEVVVEKEFMIQDPDGYLLRFNQA